MWKMYIRPSNSILSGLGALIWLAIYTSNNVCVVGCNLVRLMVYIYHSLYRSTKSSFRKLFLF